MGFRAVWTFIQKNKISSWISTEDGFRTDVRWEETSRGTLIHLWFGSRTMPESSSTTRARWRVQPFRQVFRGEEVAGFWGIKGGSSNTGNSTNKPCFYLVFSMHSFPSLGRSQLTFKFSALIAFSSYGENHNPVPAALGDPCHAGSRGERVRRALAEDRQLRGELREKCEDTHGFSVRFATQCPRMTLICVYTKTTKR